MKKSQIFKSIFNDDTFIIKFIKTHFYYDNMNKSYVSDVYIFRKCIINNDIVLLYNYIEHYYHDSKKNYPENIYTYRGFNTVLRQILKHFDIKYKYEINYIHSSYMIKYYIFLET